MAEYLDEIAGLLGARDFDKLLLWSGCSVEEAQVHRAPVNGNHVASAEPLSNSEGRFRADVDSLVDLVPAISVVPRRQHAANWQQCGVNPVIATYRVKDVIGRHVDISGVMHDDAALLQDVSNTDWFVASFPATGVVPRLNGDHIDSTAAEVIARLGFQDFGKSQICDNRRSSLWDDQLDGLVEFRERPAVEVIDVGVSDQDRSEGSVGEGSFAPQWIDKNLVLTKSDHRAGVSQPCHLSRHALSIARADCHAARWLC